MSQWLLKCFFIIIIIIIIIIIRLIGKRIHYHDLNAAKSQDIETSSYAILSILNSNGSVSDALPIVQYLMQNMNPQGGFYATQV